MKIFRKKNVTNVEVHLIKNAFKKVYKFVSQLKIYLQKICKNNWIEMLV